MNNSLFFTNFIEVLLQDTSIYQFHTFIDCVEEEEKLKESDRGTIEEVQEFQDLFPSSFQTLIPSDVVSIQLCFYN